MSQLEKLRENLELFDEIILDSLLMRNQIVKDITAIQKAGDQKILEPEQADKKKEWLKQRLRGKENQEEIESVFNEIERTGKRIQAGMLFGYNIFLIGFMGAGKSTISYFMNSLFAMDVVEMDEIIAQREKMSITDIFKVHGESYFREAETNLLIEMQSKSNMIVSCGGGVPMRERNVEEMKKNGRVVLLTATPETIFERVKDSHNRPLIENNKTVSYISELMEQRREKYEAAADIIVETDGKSGIEICDDMVKKLLRACP